MIYKIKLYWDKPKEKTKQKQTLKLAQQSVKTEEYTNEETRRNKQ
jgi:hypothetical protein